MEAYIAHLTDLDVCGTGDSTQYEKNSDLWGSCSMANRNL